MKLVRSVIYQSRPTFWFLWSVKVVRTADDQQLWDLPHAQWRNKMCMVAFRILQKGFNCHFVMKRGENLCTQGFRKWCMKFSPKGTHLLLWENYSGK
jgi:hypothetical protein